MKKILILAYFYPPAAFVGGQRVHFWAKELHRFGYYPVVVTRNWNEGQSTLTESVEDNELTVEKYDTHEIHRIPYKQTLRDKLADKKSMKVFQKALTFWELIASNFSTKALPYSSMLPYCDKLLQEDNFEAFIASGRPFQAFLIGHKLKKKHDIIWIPDFRDEWNSHYRMTIRNPLMRFIAYLERRSEQKWLSNVDHFLSVSQASIDRISQFNNKKGSIVRNGFDSIVPKQPSKDKTLRVLYAGTLYPYQDISVITESIIALQSKEIKFFFIGNFDTPKSRTYFESLQQKYPENFILIDRMPKDEFEKHISEMDLGVLTPYKNLDGCLPVKIFDYYAHGLNLLLCPSDNDLMAQFIEQTESGITVNFQEECTAYLKQQLDAKRSNTFDTPRNYDLGKEYSRLYQTEVLAKTLDTLLEKQSISL